jgi:hypothetical protein
MIFRVFDNNGNLLHEAGNFAALEVEVKAELGSKPSRLQPIKRRAHTHAESAIEAAGAKLREATHRV